MTIKSRPQEGSNFNEKDNPTSPIDFCEQKAEIFSEGTTQKFRKKNGQFFTPPKIASYMADMALDNGSDFLRILDPGAGTGVLSCALIENIVHKNGPKNVKIDVYENNQELALLLQECFDYAKDWASQRGIEVGYHIHETDFVLAAKEVLEKGSAYFYDIGISNPPYFKIGKADPRAKVAKEFIHGQPNIYSIFMGMASKLLKDNGLMVFITPRSYTAGPYFKAFRGSFFKKMTPEKVHIFESRTDAFKKESVLQENVILKARSNGKKRKVEISTSEGAADVENATSYAVPLKKVLHKRNGDIIFRLPVTNQDIELLDTVDGWNGGLHKFEMEISTGPVVDFRATEFLCSDNKHKKQKFAPLIWMHNVYSMEIKWPSKKSTKGKDKQQYIKDLEVTRKRKLLVEDSNLVLLRRFSSKEQKRRLIAAPLLKGSLGYDVIGLENHLNYIYKPDGGLTDVEALGIAGILNSSLLDRYFRISNGNTQVSSTELRAMPLPSIPVITTLGERIKELGHIPQLEEIDKMVKEAISTSTENRSG